METQIQTGQAEIFKIIIKRHVPKTNGIRRKGGWIWYAKQYSLNASKWLGIDQEKMSTNRMQIHRNIMHYGIILIKNKSVVLVFTRYI